MDWSRFDRGVFLVNLLGIVYDPKTGKVLLGRREGDPFMEKLNWCFPGGRPAYEEDLESYLSRQIKIKTGIEVEVKRVVFAKTYPEKREFLSIYYYCEAAGGQEKAGEKHVENKWVRPTEVREYFSKSASVHPKILGFLESLEEQNKQQDII